MRTTHSLQRMAAHGAMVLALLAGGSAAGVEPSPLGACGPVNRPFDVIELAALTLRKLGGTPMARLGVIAFRGGQAAPIPFQIDERVGRKVAMADGPQPMRDDLPGVLDYQDLVVFMACDAGERATPEAIAAAAGVGLTAWREVKIDDPLDHTAAYAYVLVADHPPATNRRYVEYDAAHDMVRTAEYEIGCTGTLPTWFTLALGGPMTANLLDGVRLRADARLWPNLVGWSISERDGRNKMLAWKAGAVRVIRRTEHHVNIGLGINLSAGTAHTYFSARNVYGPGALKLPFSPSVFFSDITAFAGGDMRNFRGWRYHAPGVAPQGFVVDGTTDAAEKAYAGTGDWFLLEQKDRAVLVHTVLSDNLEKAVPLSPVYVDDVARKAPPEAEVGSVPLVGFRGTGLQKLAAGRYSFQLRVSGLHPYTPGAEQRLLQQAEKGLTADTTALWPPLPAN